MFQISGYKIVKTKIAPRANGDIGRIFLVEYPFLPNVQKTI